MSKRLRILACCHRADHTGAPLLLFRLLSELAERHDVALIRPKTPIEEGSILPDYERAGIPVLKGADPARFDVLLANTVMQSVQILRAHGRIPSVWWIHEPEDGVVFLKKGQATPAAFPLADAIVFPTRWQAEVLYAPYLAGRDYDVVPYGIGGDREAKPKPFELPEGSVAMLQLGWIGSRKGQDLTVAALGMLRDPRIHVFMAGSENVHAGFAAKLRAKVARDPLLRDRVHFRGSLPASAVDAYLQHVDALLFPTNSDLISVSILEAMLHGTCVISSDYGPIPETVKHDETGLVFPVREVELYAECIRRVADDPALRRRLGEAGRAIYKAKHSFEQHVAGMEAVLLRTAR